MMRPIILVVALAENGVIGRDNQLIWRLRTDLKRFKALTLGKPMIMGRKTFQSIGKPLPGRDTIVVTRDPDFAVQGVYSASSRDAALALAESRADALGADAIAVVGGAEIYSLFLPLAERIHLTYVHARPEGDTHFPDFDCSKFRETFREAHQPGEGDEFAFTFVDLERIPS